MFAFFAALALARKAARNWELPILLVEDGSHIAKESAAEDFLTAEERFGKRRDHARAVQTSTKKKYLRSVTKRELGKAMMRLGLDENAAQLFKEAMRIERKLDLLEMLYGQLDGEPQNFVKPAQPKAPERKKAAPKARPAAAKRV